MEKHVLKYRELSKYGTLARELAFTDITFSPLGYEALRTAKLHQQIEIPLSGRGAILSSDVAEIDAGQTAKFGATLESQFTSKAIGLVKGGWLPSMLAAIDDTIVLPDRCVVAQLSARLKDGVTKPEADKDFIDLFADTVIRINPMLFVLEGDGGQNATPETIGKQLEEAVTKLRSALPKAEMVAADAKGLQGVLGLIQDTQDGIARRQDFLISLNPKLKSSVSRKNVQSCWDEVLIAADHYDIPKASLVVLAALSAVVMPQGRNPAKGLLKFGEAYGPKDAYNGLADIRALEILIYLFGLFPDQRVMLCTADKDMAMFWVGLQASNFAFSHGRMTYDIAPTDLLPGVATEKWREWLGS
ncbi:hypothetical protein [Agrobacterium vitis]|nr:hypothetical protein [Agrobacterium vitis]NSY14764.1 hypothetical protein [Agrobacterium vitis]NSY24521.1 hypothetical protein [Agrobacterium vitis]WEO75427.1 hypothetical protein G6L01_026340 [Agrobacterium vitis]